MINYIMYYIIFSYIIVLIGLGYIMRYHKERLNLSGVYSQDKAMLIMLSLCFAVSPFFIIIIIFMLIKNYIKGE